MEVVINRSFHTIIKGKATIKEFSICTCSYYFVNVLCEFHVDFDSNRIGTISLIIWYIIALSFTLIDRTMFLIITIEQTFIA